ncbi:ATP-binding protein [Microcoleus sp. AR_TQ3_B6]|uniref:ATP-binding protein n=1 Tax=Microcoleus sp. AR_TQ3_B6 TaxID=3055284 RepID=UPI002FD26231
MNLNLFGNSHPDEDYSKMDEIPSLGIGIKIISQIADELSYTHTSDRRNCLLIVKYFEPVLPHPSTQADCFKRATDTLNIFNWLKEQKTSQSDRSSNQPLQKITLQLNSDIATVTQVLWWVEQLENLPLPQEVLQLCKLATVEGFINAIHHHKNMPSNTPIDLAIAVFNERIEIQIWDWGKPLNFPSQVKVDQSQSKDTFGLKELEFMF